MGSTLKHIRAIALLPALVTVVIPAGIILVTQSIRPGFGLQPPWNCVPIALGCFLGGLGITLMITTIGLLARTGRGTLAPWDPTQRLVSRGIYRWTRNPMIIGVFSLLLGEALALGSVPLFIWFLGFLVGNLLYIPMVEEPRLAQRFGDEYLRYKREVPRWAPRFRAPEVVGDGAQVTRARDH
jgi:protein-S-isoprenylcysteine O-methyltransferase Ste14